MMAGLVTLISAAAVVGTLPILPELNRSHVLFLLLAEAGMLGVVTAWDLMLFVAFWEVTLIPFFFLMGRGPSLGGVNAATRFIVISVASSVLMWVGVLLVVQAAGLPRTFDLIELSRRLSQNQAAISSAMWLFVPAFLVRMAAFPLHTWFPVACANVPNAASVLLAGGVLPLGGFGLIHILGRLCGPQLGGMNEWLVWVGVGTALGGGIASMVQRDLKRLLANVCLSQMGIALIGLSYSLGTDLSAGAMMLFASGIAGATLFLFAGVVCRARGSQRVAEISGLWHSHPFFAGLAFTAVASAAAIPGTAGFVGVMLVLDGTANHQVITLLSAGAVLLTGASVVWAYRRILGGSHHPAVWGGPSWPRKRQAVILAILAVFILVCGLWPGLMMGVRS